jgi:hypothetical protein
MNSFMFTISIDFSGGAEAILHIKNHPTLRRVANGADAIQ